MTLFLYDKDKDRVFLGDSGDPDHNRQWISLKKVYKSLKTSNPRQILTVQKYDRSKDRLPSYKIWWYYGTTGELAAVEIKGKKRTSPEAGWCRAPKSPGEVLFVFM